MSRDNLDSMRVDNVATGVARFARTGHPAGAAAAHCSGLPQPWREVPWLAGRPQSQSHVTWLAYAIQSCRRQSRNSHRNAVAVLFSLPSGSGAVITAWQAFQPWQVLLPSCRQALHPQAWPWQRRAWLWLQRAWLWRLRAWLWQASCLALRASSFCLRTSSRFCFATSAGFAASAGLAAVAVTAGVAQA